MDREMQSKLEARTRAGMLPHNRERIVAARYRIEGLYAICELCDAKGIIVESLMIEQSKVK